MTRDFANQLDRTLEALQAALMPNIGDNREAAEAYRQIAYLRDQLKIEPCKGDSFFDIFRRS